MVAKRLVFAIYDNPLKEDYFKMAPFAKWIVIGSSPEALYNKLVYYTQHPEEENKLVQAAYQWVKNQNWEKVVEIYLRLWGKLARYSSTSFLPVNKKRFSPID